MTPSTSRDTAAIPYVDIAAQHAPLKTALMDAVSCVVDHGVFVLGPEVAEFERRFAAVCGVRYALGLNSGTDALVLALRALGVGPGAEVITVPNSFVASTSCIRLVGARPVFVDVRDDYTIDHRQVERAITERTRALIPVHLTGWPCDMDPLIGIAGKHGLPIIEDCAQAVAAAYRGRPVGSLGAVGCFSFHPLKTLNACGDGGAVTTNDPAIFEQLTLLRNIGLRTRDDCVLWAGNSRLDTIQAAMLLVKLDHLDRWTERRRENAARYRERLAPVRQVVIPQDRPSIRAVYHTFVVQVERRDALRAWLAQRGIGTAIHYPVPIHLARAAGELGYGPGSFPVTEAQSGRILSLPVHPELRPAQIDDVCAAVAAFYEQTT